jgi:hypothetical protein
MRSLKQKQRPRWAAAVPTSMNLLYIPGIQFDYSNSSSSACW